MEQKVKELLGRKSKFRIRMQLPVPQNDVFLRELEIKTFCETLKECGINKNSTILDVGCGDGYTTLNIAKNLSWKQICGD
jgi:cyclopropane fatty-acyl-phospholipid synthase-like methyltransferase